MALLGFNNCGRYQENIYLCNRLHKFIVTMFIPSKKVYQPVIKDTDCNHQFKI